MYGMVNQALQDYLEKQHGAEAWHRIARRAGVEVALFVTLEQYDDAITYNLVGAACEELDLPPRTILEGFGRHWVLCTARENYGDLLHAGGRTFVEFMQNLPNFHARVHLIYSNLQPPTFRLADVQDDSLRLHYISQRPGLADFVRGLLLGLGEMFRVSLDIEHERARADGHDRDVFLVRWKDLAP